MDRRNFLSGFAVTGAGAAVWLGAPSLKAVSADAAANAGPVTVIAFSDLGKPTGPVQVPKVRRTDEQWKQQLTSDQFLVTRRMGTERPYSGEYAESTGVGLYRCVCCSNALFSSVTKFESGTGWPSFWAPVAKENIRNTEDRSLGETRTEVACTQCDAHLGHVFNDGPQPTGLRCCMNSVALRFVKRG